MSHKNSPELICQRDCLINSRNHLHSFALDLNSMHSCRNEEKEQRLTMNDTEITRLNAELSTTRDTVKDAKNEMELLQNDLQAINMLFTRILTNKDNFDLDRLRNVLEENRMLLTEVTTRSNDCSIIADSVLPKLLCDLIVGAFAEPEIPMESSDENPGEEDTPTIVNKPDLLATDEIIENLPKIWRILTELLIHQKTTQFNWIDSSGKSEDCYKTVDTPTGPQLVLSVSKTFIKLKDLILEKKGLQKETKRLKVLNEHLQQTLNTQEDRLGAVSVEVTKTWHLVNRMQRQHRQLHTKEQVLRYHLQQKRRMLSVLKEELETCRHKWTKAREKNESSEIQWRLLRDEFTSRKEKSQSVESGYSDDPVTDEDVEGEGKKKKTESVPQLPVTLPPPPPIEIADPIDETLEQMFYRLNAIHTANSYNFDAVLEEPPIIASVPNSPTTIVAQPNVEVEISRTLGVFAEGPPELIDESTVVAVQANESELVSQDGSSSTSDSSLESGEDAVPSSSGLTTAEEEYTAHRNERIKRLEEQCKALFDKMTSNKKKGEELSEQLDNSINSRQLERDIATANTTSSEEGPSTGGAVEDAASGEGSKGEEGNVEISSEETVPNETTTVTEALPTEDHPNNDDQDNNTPSCD